MNEINTIGGKGDVLVTVRHKERKWFHKLLGTNNPKPVVGLTLSDFEATKSEIHCVVDNGNGYYEFHIASDVDIKIK